MSPMLFDIAEYGAAYMGVFVGAVVLIISAPNDATKCGCVLGIVGIVSFVLMILSATVTDNPEYWAYEYDKVLAKRETVVRSCPDTTLNLCRTRMNEYRADSLKAYNRFEKERHK